MSHELCARFHHAVELIGRRWSGAVIQLLLHEPASRYGELRAAIPDISDRMLSERLRELEEAGILVRKVIPDTPVRVEYALTEKGRALKPAVEAIGAWAERWVDAKVAKARCEEVEKQEASARPAAKAPAERPERARRRVHQSSR
jgi:DNA-binding HxlR family transcriptional regulator